MARKPRIDPALLLDGIPVANQSVRVEEQTKGLLLWVPVRQRGWMKPLAYFMPIRNEKGVALDALGQEVFRACDGVRTTETIVEEFAARHQIRFHDARIAVLSFLKSLIERNLVALVTEKDRASETSR